MARPDIFLSGRVNSVLFRVFLVVWSLRSSPGCSFFHGGAILYAGSAPELSLDQSAGDHTFLSILSPLTESLTSFLLPCNVIFSLLMAFHGPHHLSVASCLFQATGCRFLLFLPPFLPFSCLHPLRYGARVVFSLADFALFAFHVIWFCLKSLVGLMFSCQLLI